ncbi:uncharacterized protein LOC111376884 isoform X2 [Olea europaea var. sylvestris]|uniref:uncharacterized protein LOC111376884 isoform X2 n=1 Tax=Olea europaea var. sylvestris TaxID=158386 RepID=UPI000C1D0F94|nr:uncharacterized protein LOC111376884 isoform X2 [Olea europaea var. sylvestris]
MQTMYQKKMFHRFSRKRSQKSIKFALPRAMFHFLLSEFLLCTNFYFFLYRIGIRSQDLQDLFERTVKGSGIALSSPRLVILAAIYGLWELSQHFGHDIFDFQLVPAMVGLFAYKAAALVQVYRDNEDLQFIFPDNAEGSSD